MRTIVWAAVSSKPQADEDKDSIPTQIASAREAIERNGWDEVASPLVVGGYSRNYIFLAEASQQVPEYAQLIELATANAFDLLIVRDRSRLGRTDALVAQVDAILRHNGVQILSLDMPTLIQSPEEFREARDRSAIWSSAVERARAEDEITQLKARYQFGMKGRTRRGLHPNSVPFGYRKGDDGVGELYEPEAAVVRLMYHWLLEGKTLSDIQRKLPHHATEHYPQSLSSIKYVLQNPYNCGIVAWSRLYRKWRPKERETWTEGEGLHQPIIDQATWELAQRELERRRGTPRTRYPLTGVVYCRHCGRTMKGATSWNRSRNVYRYYVCARPDCQRNSYRADVLESEMAEWIQLVNEDPAALEDEIQQALARADGAQADEIEQMGATLDRKRKSLHRWATDYELGLLSREDYYTHRARLMDEIASLDAAVAKAAQNAREPDRASEVVGNLAEQTDWMDRETAGLIRTQLASIGLRITIAEGHAEVSLSA